MRTLALSDEILMKVDKAARYIGGEVNSVMKDKNDVDIRFAMCFPDVYEIGMSNLGMMILYNMFNEREDVWCERVFSPWMDLDKIMREEHIPLFALESQEPVKEFDFLGITLGYEMCYTNVLQVLDLSHVSLLAKDRKEDDPIVIGGGACAYNPEPIAEFFDMFYIGEGETVYDQLLDIYKENKKNGGSRWDYLAKAAEVEVIVAVNKIDKEGANVDRVKQELTEYGLIAEDWGGSTVFVPVSAKTGEGIDELLEMITLTAEVLELKANAKRRARGLVIEAKLDKGRGPVATILIQKGTLHVGDSINVGHAFGRVRAMMDDKGNRVKVAGPSTPVEILGLNDVPFSGEVLMAHGNEKEARATADAFIAYGREKMLEETKNKLSLDDLFDQIQAGNVKELNLVVKADVQGSVEAVKQSLMKLSNEEVMIKVVHGGVGAINESDVILASASNAIIIGFNVRPDAMAKAAAEREKVDMRLYRVIYNAIEDIEAAIKGMLDPVYREKVIGHVEVRQIYKASGVGTIAGCYVLDGTITKDAQSRIVRDGIVIYEGELASLKRFKDDVKEVKAGFECGIVFEKYNDIKEGDQIEAFVMEEIPR